jgi:hypothetical protein
MLYQQAVKDKFLYDKWLKRKIYDDIVQESTPFINEYNLLYFYKVKVNTLVSIETKLFGLIRILNYENIVFGSIY